MRKWFSRRGTIVERKPGGSDPLWRAMWVRPNRRTMSSCCRSGETGTGALRSRQSPSATKLPILKTAMRFSGIGVSPPDTLPGMLPGSGSDCLPNALRIVGISGFKIRVATSSGSAAADWCRDLRRTRTFQEICSGAIGERDLARQPDRQRKPAGDPGWHLAAGSAGGE